MSSKEIIKTEKEYILSICIPTYNRDKYLSRLLNSIVKQINHDKLPVEVCITDNASEDLTENICRQYEQDYDFIKYNRQNVNTGADKNIAEAYKMGTGDFVWIIGDDDDIVDNCMHHLVSLLLKERNNTALIYLSSVFIPSHSKKWHQIKKNNNFLLHTMLCIDPISIIKRAGIEITFISGIIINKYRYPINIDEISNLYETNLVQLSWVFNALKKGEKFIHVKNPIIIAEPNNSGGYNIFRVFSSNFIKITESYFHNNDKIINIFRTESLYFVMPFLFNKKIGKNFDTDNAKLITDLHYSTLFVYKKIFRKLLNSPVILKNIYHVMVRVRKLLY
ncbi:glycosyltransferase family 2 protein [Xenorhabdus bovienii]|uniref:glycosyltransferase family 2 protein n=1 Tax=Xenorhabdus bovienii TaxID=40576 RepID=UPI0023B2AB28|nr:glycosyltransferase family 2 protein [Xenorhabdus bovienii]MDE9550832.1 glycosyltransferase [Xenorhabdus bovienii]